jgi:hypothetical protein
MLATTTSQFPIGASTRQQSDEEPGHPDVIELQEGSRQEPQRRSGRQAAVLLAGITGEQVAQIALGATEADSVGKGVFRRHACGRAAHEGRFSFIWPREIPRDHLRERELGGTADGAPVFPTRKGGRASKAEWAAALKTCVTPLDVFRLTGHSPRRSGAKFLARLEMARWKIQFLARWGTSVVDLYVEEAYAEAAATHSLDSLAKTGESGLKLGGIQCAVAECLQARGSSGNAVVSGENAAGTEISMLVSGLDAKWAVQALVFATCIGKAQTEIVIKHNCTEEGPASSIASSFTSMASASLTVSGSTVTSIGYFATFLIGFVLGYLWATIRAWCARRQSPTRAVERERQTVFFLTPTRGVLHLEPDCRQIVNSQNNKLIEVCKTCLADAAVHEHVD